MNWKAEADKVHAQAVELLQKHGRIPFMLRTYPFPTDNCVVWVVEEGLTGVACSQLSIAAALFRVTQPAAVLLQADVFGTNNVVFSKHFGIPADTPFEEFQERYHRILKEQYGGLIRNLPAELVCETILTVLKGPGFMPISYFANYHREGDKIVIDEPEKQMDGFGILNILPDWWEQKVH